jgi:hypothetical protein
MNPDGSTLATGSLQADGDYESAQATSSTRRRFASLVKTVSFLSPSKQDDEQAGTIDDEISRMEAKLNDPPDDLTPAGDTNTLPRNPGGGMIETGRAPTPAATEMTSLENSAQLPAAVFYNDPFLVGLINDTLAGNQELKILCEEIRIACNESYARSGEYRPFVNLGLVRDLINPGLTRVKVPSRTSLT